MVCLVDQVGLLRKSCLICHFETLTKHISHQIVMLSKNQVINLLVGLFADFVVRKRIDLPNVAIRSIAAPVTRMFRD